MARRRHPPRGLIARFGPQADGISSLEFAIVFPVLMVFLLGGSQFIIYLNAVRKVEAAAASISEMLSQTYNGASPNASTFYVTATDLQFATDQTMIVFPYVMKDAARQNLSWPQDISVSLASISFTANGQTCGGYDQSACYTAKTVWTTTASNSRACGVLQPTTSTAPNKATLPSYVFGPGTLIAVDIVFNFTPSFGASFFGTRSIARSVYVQPRYTSLIDFNTANNTGIAKEC